jgi:oligopeptide/dipeptide ABC transporter ATP-binding protein
MLWIQKACFDESARELKTSGCEMSDVLTESVLEVKGLKIGFPIGVGYDYVVDGVDFEIPRGNVVGLLGESGAGKSLIAEAIMGLIKIPPAKVEGEVLFKGMNVFKMNDAALSNVRGKDLGMIMQDPTSALNPVFRVGAQVAEPIQLHLKKKKKAAWQMAIDIFKNMVGIPSAESRVKDYPHQFSGGMKQRVVIGMGLSCNPLLLIADEPTCSLDVTIQAQILELIQKLVSELGTSVLYISNDLGVISQMCRDVIILYAGRIVEKGDVDLVLNRPQHPYTKGLIRSVPRLGVRRLESIPGTIPSLGEYPKGCRFWPRCPEAFDKCFELPPPLFESKAETGHEVACWKCERIPSG